MRFGHRAGDGRTILRTYPIVWLTTPEILVESPPVKRISQFILVLLVALSVGLHWVVLQSVAWTGMFVDYASDHTLAVAIEKTFDGSNKCEICKIVDEGTQEESSELLKIQKLDAFTGPASAAVYPPTVFTFALLDQTRSIHRRTDQAQPPPRSA